MYLQEGEKIIKRVHHHYFFVILNAIRIWIYSLPFYFMGWVITHVMSLQIQFYTYLGITIVFALVWFYDALIYYLDSLILTNKRIIYMDWKTPFVREEIQGKLADIQNISTKENGILSGIDLFDFGTVRVETSSTRSVIFFDEAPNPEGLRFFIYNLVKEHCNIDLTKRS